MEAGSCGACTPRCGAQKIFDQGGGLWYAQYDLPSGACTQEGQACTMSALDEIHQCSDGTITGCNVTGYACACVTGQWSCQIISEGTGGGCGCLNDGGHD